MGLIVTNSLIVRGKAELTSLEKTGRAAQYVRMSTDKQRNSTQNQAQPSPPMPRNTT